MSEMLGNQLFLAGKYGQAISQFREVLERNSTHLGVKSKLAFALAWEGDLEESLELLEQLLQVDPEGVVGSLREICLQKEVKVDREKFTSVCRRAVIALFCDRGAALEWLRRAVSLRADERLEKFINILENV